MVTQGMTAAEYSLFRSAFNMICAILLLRSQNIRVFEGVTREHVPALLIRCGVGTLNFILVMYCVKLLPLTIYFMISQMAPFFTALIAWIWLSESITKFELFAIVGSYFGIAMIGIS
jgi:drug/metabolite transporter (DMT)-like permease